jgi:hypothetical protein
MLGSLLTHTELRLGTEKVAECIRRIATVEAVAARNGLDVINRRIPGDIELTASGL